MRASKPIELYLAEQRKIQEAVFPIRKASWDAAARRLTSQEMIREPGRPSGQELLKLVVGPRTEAISELVV
jgi:hypothetical protein